MERVVGKSWVWWLGERCGCEGWDAGSEERMEWVEEVYVGKRCCAGRSDFADNTQVGSWVWRVEVVRVGSWRVEVVRVGSWIVEGLMEGDLTG